MLKASYKFWSFKKNPNKNKKKQPHIEHKPNPNQTK